MPQQASEERIHTNPPRPKMTAPPVKIETYRYCVTLHGEKFFVTTNTPLQDLVPEARKAGHDFFEPATTDFQKKVDRSLDRLIGLFEATTARPSVIIRVEDDKGKEVPKDKFSDWYFASTFDLLQTPSAYRADADFRSIVDDNIKIEAVPEKKPVPKP